jgi:hypothetical protein
MSTPSCIWEPKFSSLDGGVVAANRLSRHGRNPGDQVDELADAAKA